VRPKATKVVQLLVLAIFFSHRFLSKNAVSQCKHQLLIDARRCWCSCLVVAGQRHLEYSVVTLVDQNKSAELLGSYGILLSGTHRHLCSKPLDMPVEYFSLLRFIYFSFAD
jgi:hypothetical protein